jgi:hypothetical protein
MCGRFVGAVVQGVAERIEEMGPDFIHREIQIFVRGPK